MANILLTWEAGTGLGHLVNLKPFAWHLAQRGHRVFAALQDMSRAPSIFQGAPVEFLQAPIRVRYGNDQIRVPQTFAQILHNLSFSESRELQALTGAWRHLFNYVRPDLIVMNHSPTALLASCGLKAKRVLVGTGFYSPPRVSPLPNLRPGLPVEPEQLLTEEQELLDRVNPLLSSWGQPPLTKLADLYAQVDVDYLATFPELDHYPERECGNYIGAWPGGVGKPPAWPRGDGPRIYAYLKQFPGIEAVLAMLADSGRPALVHVDGIDPRLQERFRSNLLRIEDQPVELGRVAHQCELAVLHGNHGTTAAMMLAGTPTLQLPLYLEQSLLAAAVARMGAGLSASAKDTSAIAQGLDAMLADNRYRQSARHFARRYANFNAESQIDLVMSQIEDLLAGRESTFTPRVEPRVALDELQLVEPRMLVHPKRFDLMAKHLYARHRAMGVRCNWARDLYREHLKITSEHGQTAPGWESPQDRQARFDRMLDAIALHGYDTVHPPVTVGSDGALIDGAHRVAACLAHEKPVPCELYQQPGPDFSAGWMRRAEGKAATGLPTWCGDPMALEYCRLRQDVQIVVLLPAVDVDDNLVERLLSEQGAIVYSKRALLSPRGLANLLTHWRLLQKGASVKRRSPDASQKPIIRPLRVYLFQGRTANAANRFRKAAELKLGVAPEVVLIPPTPEQTCRMAELTLSDRSIDRLNHALPVDTVNLPAVLRGLTQHIDGHGLDRERYCLGGALALSAFGIGLPGKLEVLCRGQDVPAGGDDAVVFQTDTIGNYGKAIDEILFDPRNHFYAYGLKFAAWPVVSHLLRAFGLPTDVAQLAEMDAESILRMEASSVG